jgi:hypothetical protein
VNYTELYAAIVDFTESSEQLFLDNIPVFVEQAEARIYNSVQLPALRKNVLGTMTVNNKYLSCPNDFLSSFSLALVDDLIGSLTVFLHPAREVGAIKKIGPFR